MWSPLTRTGLSRRAVLVLAACAAFTLAWYAFVTAGVGYGHDETITMDQVDNGFRDFMRAVRRDTGPPGWFFGIWLWHRVAAPSEWAMRLPGALASAIVPLPLFLVFRRFASERASLLAVVLTTVSPFFVRYVPELRFYAVLQLLVALSTLAMLRLEESIDSPGRSWIARGLVWSLTGCFVLYTHTLAAFYLWSHGLYLLARRGTRDMVRWLPFLALAGLSFLPWLPFALEQRDRPHLDWIAADLGRDIGLPLLADLAVEFVGGSCDPASNLVRQGPATFLFAPLLAVGLLALSRRGERSMLAPVLLVVPVTLLLAISYARPLFVSRYLIPSLPYLFLCIAVGTERIASRPWRLAVAGACIAVLAAATWRNRVGWPADDWRGSARALVAVDRHARSGEVAVLAERWEYATITLWHLEREIAAADLPLSPTVLPLPRKKQVASFVADPPSAFWYCASPGSLGGMLDRLAASGRVYHPVAAIPSAGSDRRCLYWRLERLD